MRFLRATAVVALFAGALWAFSASPFAVTTTTGSASLSAIDIAYTQNFNTLANTPDAGLFSMLPAGWSIDESGSSARNDGKYAVGTGSSATGDTYAYGPVPAAIRARVDQLHAVCDRHGVPLVAAALQFSAAQPAGLSLSSPPSTTSVGTVIRS